MYTETQDSRNLRHLNNCSFSIAEKLRFCDRIITEIDTATDNRVADNRAKWEIEKSTLLEKYELELPTIQKKLTDESIFKQYYLQYCNELYEEQHPGLSAKCTFLKVVVITFTSIICISAFFSLYTFWLYLSPKVMDTELSKETLKISSVLLELIAATLVTGYLIHLLGLIAIRNSLKNSSDESIPLRTISETV